jgi:DNA-directed RNA polymerase specialized sigma24 family protein
VTPALEFLFQAQPRFHELALLSPRRRLAWTWVKIVGLSYKETAAVMGISVGTVQSHVRDAKKSLGEMLKRDGSDEN